MILWPMALFYVFFETLVAYFSKKRRDGNRHKQGQHIQYAAILGLVFFPHFIYVFKQILLLNCLKFMKYLCSMMRPKNTK